MTMFYNGKQICLTRYNEDGTMAKEVVAFKTETDWTATCWKVWEIDAEGNKEKWGYLEADLHVIWRYLWHLVRTE